MSSNRRSFTAAFKLDMIKEAEKHGNRPTARKYHLDESSLRQWRKLKSTIEKMPKKMRNRSVCPAKWPELEDKLTVCICTLRADGHPVSTVTIRLQAKERARKDNIQDFHGSLNWCFRFMKRKKLSVRTKTSVGQKLPDDWEEKSVKFQRFVERIVRKKKIRPDDIINMDEVPLTFDAPPNRTVDIKGVKSINIKTTGHEKTRFTVVLACSATGTKLPTMLIFRRKTIPKEEFPPGIIVRANAKAWMTEEVMLEWIDSALPNNRERNILLVVDSVSTHITESVRDRCRQRGISLAVIPGGLTKKIQPLDLTINHVFKLEVRRQWEQWMASGLKTYTKTGRMRKATFAEVAQWVKTAFHAVKITTVAKAFQSAGIIPKPASAVDNNQPSTSAGPAQESDSSSEGGDSGESDEEALLDPEMAALFCSDSQDSDFEGFDSDTASSDEDSVVSPKMSEQDILSYFYSDSDESEFLGFE